MFKAATIKDIAKALNISASTVSRALSDSHEVGAQTKQKVLAYAEKISFRYNPVAQSLRKRKSYSIGVMVADIANNFFAQTIDGIESVAYENNYHVIITQSHDAYERELINIRHLANRSVDGLLISMSAETTDYSHITELHKQGLPIVFFDRILDEVDTFKVTTDNFKVGYDATSLLISKGHKRIAHLANAPQLSITIERMNGYKASLADHQIPFKEDLVKYCFRGGKDSDEVEANIKTLFGAAEQPDALFIASDSISTASLRILNKYFSNMDLTVLGFSNLEVIDLLNPLISCVRQKAFEMGRIAAQMLIRLIESKYPVHEMETRRLDAEIVWNGIDKADEMQPVNNTSYKTKVI